MEPKASLGKRIGQALWLAGTLLVVCGIMWFASLWVKPHDDGNPNRPRTPQQIAKADEVKRDNEAYEQRKRYWLDEIRAGNASFREAACELEDDGEWNESANKCESHLMPAVPASR